MTLLQYRARHIHCITGQQIRKDIEQGRLPYGMASRMKEDRRLHAACSCPEDNLCMAPDVPDQRYHEFLIKQ